MIRIAQTGDFHIGPSGPELDPETGLNARMLDRARTAELAMDEMCKACDLVIHCGDVWHSPRPTPTEVRKAKVAFDALARCGRVGMVLMGNHDSPKNPREDNALSYLEDDLMIVDRPMVVNVWRDSDNGSGYVLRESADGAPNGYYIPTIRMQIACMPYPYMSALLRDEDAQRLDPGQRALLMREKVMDVLRGTKAQQQPGIPMILAAHLSVDTATTGAGDRMMMLGGEWTLDARELDALGFDAVLLGHIHKHQFIEDVETPMAYSGSLEPVTFAEEGDPKGWMCWEIISAPDHPGTISTFVPVENRRMITYDEVQIRPGDPKLPNIWEQQPLGSHAGLIVRVRVPGTMAPQVTRIKRRLLELGAFSVQVEVVPVEHVRRREVTVAHSMDLGEAMAAWMEQVPAAKSQGESLVAMAKEVVNTTEGAAS